MLLASGLQLDTDSCRAMFYLIPAETTVLEEALLSVSLLTPSRDARSQTNERRFFPDVGVVTLAASSLHDITKFIIGCKYQENGMLMSACVSGSLSYIG